jgi:phosphonopyruvate decarboxylase
MGTASSMGLGLALARPHLKVIVLDGDGSLLMNLGSLVTIAGEAPANLVLFIVENGSYALSGQQPLPGVGKAYLSELARAAGFEKVHEISSVSALSGGLGDIMSAQGPVFVSLKLESEPTPYLDRMTTPAFRNRTGPVGWHKLHGLLQQE